MNYNNTGIKIIDWVSYLNTGKINLSPVFQRGHVWQIGDRKSLVKNMVATKPIPAVFLYKKESGSTYTYNILDGKQRIESLILFIGNRRNDLKIDNWRDYFFNERERKSVNFPVVIDNKKVRFKDFDDDQVRAFGEYIIPTIEITMEEDTDLSEIISLFIDINQRGEAVKRFDIVKAICRTDRIMKQTFDLVALKQKRRKDVYYKMIDNEFTYVLKRTSLISKTSAPNSKVDKMWERLLEISIFAISKEHRKPADVLKGFISPPKQSDRPHLLAKEHLDNLRNVFRFLKQAYSPNLNLSSSKLATDMTHFYTMVTTLIDSDLIRTLKPKKLVDKLTALSGLIAKRKKISELIDKKMKEYLDLSAKHTTDVSRRKRRGELFLEIIKSLK